MRGYVRDGEVSAQEDGRKIFVRMKCRATMKLNVRYSLRGLFQRSSLGDPLNLVSADCSCPAGQAPATCKHVGAMCYGVEHLCRAGVFEGVTSCTEQLQRWNAPPSTRAVTDMQFNRLQFGKAQRGGGRADYDCRPEALRSMNPKAHVEGFRAVLRNNPKLANSCFSRLLRPAPPLPSPASLTVTPLNSTLLLSVKALRNTLQICTRPPGLVKFTEGCDLAAADFGRMFLQGLALSPRQQHAVEFRTRGQNTNPQWYDFRWGRVTASRFGAVARRTKPAGPLVQSFLYAKPLPDLPALRWGRDHEGEARTAYVDTRGTGVKVAERGLMVHSCGFLACSPDGIIYEGSGEGLLEIKCPFTARDMDIETACLMLPHFCSSLSPEGIPSLKRNHDYFFQIQGSMGLLGLKFCDFVLWTTKDVSVERVEFDKRLWENILLPKLNQFYFSFMLPEIILPVYPDSVIVERNIVQL